MITRNYETKTYTKTEKVMVSEKRFCDCCGKEITGEHWEVTTGHHDWGNDSYESIENQDACSAECLTKMFDAYIVRSHDCYNSEYLEVRRLSYSDVRGEIKYD